MNPRYLVNLEFTNVRVEVWLNRIPVGFVKPMDGSPLVIPVNQFIEHGENKLSLLLNFGPLAADPVAAWTKEPEALHYTGSASVRAAIALYKEEEENPFAKQPPALATVEWKGTASPQPSFLEKAFQAPVDFGQWAWESAAVLPSMDGALRASAIGYLNHLHTLLDQRRFAEFIAEGSRRFDEMGRAYGMPMEGLRGAMLSGLNAQEKDHLVPFDPSAIDLRLVAGNRMIECLRRDRKFLFEYDQPDPAQTFFLPLMIGQVQNKWTILH